MGEAQFPDLLMHVTKLLKKTVAEMDLAIKLEEKALVSSTSFKMKVCVI